MHPNKFDHEIEIQRNFHRQVTLQCKIRLFLSSPKFKHIPCKTKHIQKIKTPKNRLPEEKNIPAFYGTLSFIIVINLEIKFRSIQICKHHTDRGSKKTIDSKNPRSLTKWFWSLVSRFQRVYKERQKLKQIFHNNFQHKFKLSKKNSIEYIPFEICISLLERETKNNY